MSVFFYFTPDLEQNFAVPQITNKGMKNRELIKLSSTFRAIKVVAHDTFRPSDFKFSSVCVCVNTSENFCITRPRFPKMVMCVATWSVEATEVAEPSPTAALHRIAPSNAFDAIPACRAAAPAHLSHKPLDFFVARRILLLPLLVLGAGRVVVPNNVALQAPLVFSIHGAHEVMLRR